MKFPVLLSFSNPLNEIPNPLSPVQSPKLVELISTIFQFISTIGPIFITITIIVGGYFIVTASGDERKFRSGKKIIIVSLVCLIFVAMASLIKERIIEFLNEITK